ncbi:probable low-specificity L-threonine aldolase 2 isoform X1 [Cotesia glomerata]|uniref:Aromatic amino acid beta-eliminating lyase/threonine aldolase domain-containing protein n=2 Tax=Cotesia glomerata TaxID=32391 RepID=A0AAV7I5I6_COTGL|nr:probable low-specificity L-threonine aldolase 2 isoform X1 [Cotesia glomerata]XP_044575591.1 probable low-specificity L-threonine aldolase 2 isoform X1 [Cotesia glomerata]KAH0540501.1 hypothetical protein KQX54_017806 [Cotesia glomerata]
MYSVEKNNSDEVMVVNLRSDTFTKPSKEMRQAMFDAEVGDDVCEEDPTVIKLQKVAAELLGKEAALFVPSGSMGNLIAIMVHCDQRGCEIYLGEDCHIVQHEQGAAAQIAGVTISTIPNNSNGTFNINTIKSRLRDSKNVHHPISRMIAVENTLNGKILPLEWLKEVVEFGKNNNLKVHMDGARLWNAAIGSNTCVKDIVRGLDSVTFCLSKGLGAPVGSVLCGSSEFIIKARRCRKLLGGGMRQVGVLAAAGLVALDGRFRLHKDHEKATAMMKAINQMNSKIINVNAASVQTNMVFVDVNNSEAIDAEKVVHRLGTVVDDHPDDQVIVKAWAEWEGCLRLVFHLDISDEMLNAAIKKFKYVISQFDPAIIN